MSKQEYLMDKNERSTDATREQWSMPRIEDYGIVSVTRTFDGPGIDLFEESNPTEYGS